MANRQMRGWSSHIVREAGELGDHRRDWQTTLGVLDLSSLLAIAWRFRRSRDALGDYLLYAAAPGDLASAKFTRPISKS
jgi:hypothetical protein